MSTLVRKVHFTWKDESPPAELFPEWWRATWQQPGWELRLWTDADIEAFLKAEFPLIASIPFSHPVMRSDVFRYLLLKRTGGLYVDLDFVNLTTLDWLEGISCFACGEQQAGVLCNAFLWAPHAEDPFFEGIEDALQAYSGEQNPVYATGPRFLSRYAQGRGISRIPGSQLYPVAWDESAAINNLRSMELDSLRRKFPASRAIHLWSRSWFR